MYKAAKKLNTKYDDLKKCRRGQRRLYHDDITIVVIFIDHELLGKTNSIPELSVRGFVDAVGPSKFNTLQGTDADASLLSNQVQSV